jgi:opacity protein-like surface antigen
MLMKRLLLLAVILLGFSVVVFAQEAPKVEIFGGYSYVKCHPGNNEQCGQNGVDFSVGINANKYLGVVADFAGQLGKTKSKPNVDNFSFMFGPKVAFRKGKFTPFTQALFGAARVKPGLYSQTRYENEFAMAFGAGVDIVVTKVLAIRPLQWDYYIVKRGSDLVRNNRYGAGIVFRLGGGK